MAKGKEYEKRTDESVKAYAAFCVYLSLGENRSLIKAIEAQGRVGAGSKRLFEKWSSLYDWVKRAAAYDSEVIVEAMEKARKKAVRDKASLLTLASDGLALLLQKRTVTKKRTGTREAMTPEGLVKSLAIDTSETVDELPDTKAVLFVLERLMPDHYGAEKQVEVAASPEEISEAIRKAMQEGRLA